MVSRSSLNRPLAGLILIFFLATAVLPVSPVVEGACAATSVSTPEQQYEVLLKEFVKLRDDKKKAGLRENWDKLRKRFAALAEQKNNTAPKALFQQAKVQESLAVRSNSAKDYELALALFAQVPDKYPKHSFSADALYSRALILEKLGRPDDAKRDLERIIKQYKKSGSIVSKADSKLQELTAATVSAKPVNAGKAKVAAQNKEEQRAASDAAKAADLYAEAVKGWRILLADKEKSKKSANWLTVAAAFYKAYVLAPRSEVAPKALFQTARAYEELGLRLRNKEDWEKAVDAYSRLAGEFPMDSLSDDALYHAAVIKCKRLNQPEDARVLAERILSDHPKGDMIGNAKSLLAALEKNKTKNSVGEDSKKDTKTAAGFSVLEDITWSGTASVCTLTFSFNQSAAFKHEFIGPDKKSGRLARLIVELENVSPGKDIKGSKKISGLPVTRALTEKSSAGKVLRVVFDLGANIKEYKVSSLENPYRVVFELSQRKGGLKDAVALDQSPAGPTALRLSQSGQPERPAQSPVVQNKAARDAPAPSKQVGAGESRLADQLGLNIKTIMIDAGHGGKDPGAMAGGVVEKKVTLQAAKMLGDKLVKSGFNVIYSREKDIFIPLQDRPTLANSRKADLFVSLHINANNDPTVSGLETYYLDVASSSNAVRVAARENGVSISKISDLQAILADFMLDSRLNESRELAQSMHDSIHKNVRRNGFNIGDNGVRSAPFYVLMGARMPAVLVEAGYLTNASDIALLQNEAYLQKFTDGITGAIVAYKRKIALSTAK